MAAEAREPLAACAKRVEQVETGDAPARAFAAPFRVERDQDRGPAVALGHPRGADADDPGVPALAPQDDRGPRLAVGLVLREQPVRVCKDLALGLAAVEVRPVELGRDLAPRARDRP